MLRPFSFHTSDIPFQTSQRQQAWQFSYTSLSVQLHKNISTKATSCKWNKLHNFKASTHTVTLRNICIHHVNFGHTVTAVAGCCFYVMQCFHALKYKNCPSLQLPADGAADLRIGRASLFGSRTPVHDGSLAQLTCATIEAGRQHCGHSVFFFQL